MISFLPDQMIASFQDLKNKEDLTLTPSVGAESTDHAMDITVIEGEDVQRYEDIRDMAQRVRDVIRDILERNDIGTATPQEFIKQINDPNRLADDTRQDSLKYLMTRENALLTLAVRETLPSEDPVSVLTEAAKERPLFIWALAVNSSGDAVASLFSPGELNKTLTSETTPLARAAPEE